MSINVYFITICHKICFQVHVRHWSVVLCTQFKVKLCCYNLNVHSDTIRHVTHDVNMQEFHPQELQIMVLANVHLICTL